MLSTQPLKDSSELSLAFNKSSTSSKSLYILSNQLWKAQCVIFIKLSTPHLGMVGLNNCFRTKAFTECAVITKVNQIAAAELG